MYVLILMACCQNSFKKRIGMSQFLRTMLFAWVVLLSCVPVLAVSSYGYDDGQVAVVNGKACFYTQNQNDWEVGGINHLVIDSIPRDDAKAKYYTLLGPENPKRGRNRANCFVVNNLSWAYNQPYDLQLLTKEGTEPHYLSFCLKKQSDEVKAYGVTDGVCDDNYFDQMSLASRLFFTFLLLIGVLLYWTVKSQY